MPDPAIADKLSHRRGRIQDAPPDCLRHGPGQKMLRRIPRRDRKDGSHGCWRDCGGRGRGHGRKAGQALPPGHLPDRIGHPDQHERQRGPVEPRDPDSGRCRRNQIPRPPQRPRQHGTIQQRLLSDRHAYIDRQDGHGGHTPWPQDSPRLSLPKEQGVRPHCQDWSDPLPGCDPPDGRPGIQRICPAGRVRHPATGERPPLDLPVGAGGNRRRNRPQHHQGI
mmetsp:Transcript_15280/g.35220  ORF Transcript_15280/g.35220 Transcript_15280/m.35220 type:complete len:222 (+) Transcript_15280:321-986(+)